MTKKGKILTGVDRLVDLVNKKKKIDLDKAASELGVSKEVVQEWADFLDENGLISIEYSLSKTYLVERQLSSREVKKKSKEYDAKKDAFVRKVETTLKTLDSESVGFEELKSKFNELEKDIGTEIERVKDEVKELKHYDDIKKNLDQEILDQKLKFQNMFDDLHKQIKFEEKKYDSIVEKIQQEKSKIKEEELDLEYMENKEDNLKRRIDALREVLKTIEKDVSGEEDFLKSEHDKLKEMEKKADGMIKEVKKKKKEDLKPLVDESKEHEEKIMTIEDNIMKKVRAEKEKIKEYETEGKKIVEEFQTFFDKRADTRKLLDTIEEEKIELENEMHELIKSAKAFQLATKSDDYEKHVKDLESKFESLTEKKEDLKKNLKELAAKVLGSKDEKK